MTALVGSYVEDFNGMAVKATQFQDATGAVITFTPAAGTTTDNAIARYDGTSGAIQNSAVTIADTTGLITFTAIGGGIKLKQGSNGKCGTFVANGTSAVTVSNTSIAITDTIVISLNTVGGTVGAVPAIQTITAGTGFTVKATASDTSTYNYAIISNAS